MALQIALFGQADFGRACLDRLLEEGHKVAAVFAPPDTGRPEALASAASELGLPLVRRRYFQKRGGAAIPEALESYRRLDVDLNVLASFTSFLPPAITDAPRHKSICFHPSLLPRFRGGAAMQWQIILGETETGVTIFVPDAGVDTGPIVVQKGGVRIGPTDTTGKLFFRKLSPLGVEAIVEAANQIDQGTARLAPQDEAGATFQGLVADADAAIDLERPAEEIDRLVRGCDPQPGAHVRWNSEVLRLYDARLEPGSAARAGTVSAVEDDGFVLALQGASLRIGRVRSDGSKEGARAFAERRGLRAGDRVENG
jgi:methionyl-tRNA formyltransferase